MELYNFHTRPLARLSAGLKELRDPPPAGNLPCLDVLRSLAISLVFVYHMQGNFPHALRTLKSPVVRFGWTGVDLFFILSGLLLGGQLWRELKATETVEVGRFILRRGFRVWPLYYSLVAFLLAERIFLGMKRPGLYLWLDATFLDNYFTSHHQIGGGWSLALEEQFYLVIPIVLMVGAKFIRPRSLVRLTCIWFLALPLIRYFALLGCSTPDARHHAVNYSFFTHSDGLAMGLVISWVMNWKPELLKDRRWLDVALAGVVVGGFSLWYVAPLTFLYSVVALSYGALTFLLLRTRLHFILPSRIFYIISRLSFGVYLIHPGLLEHVMPYHTEFFGEGFRSYLLAFILWGTVSLALAFVSFSFIELPFLQLRDRRRSVMVPASTGQPLTTESLAFTRLS